MSFLKFHSICTQFIHVLLITHFSYRIFSSMHFKTSPFILSALQRILLNSSLWNTTISWKLEKRTILVRAVFSRRLQWIRPSYASKYMAESETIYLMKWNFYTAWKNGLNSKKIDQKDSCIPPTDKIK